MNIPCNECIVKAICTKFLDCELFDKWYNKIRKSYSYSTVWEYTFKERKAIEQYKNILSDKWDYEEGE